MVRAPCCDKMGLKKGPWTADEDKILVNYIQLYGHGNWRALPKLAGLLRCGKSCRLRWSNYLKPDIKRGNFSREEEDTILKLHQMLGNRWSTIAASLPGRTDNEIKNVWHTHLKKRLKQSTEETKMDIAKLKYSFQDEQILENIKSETSLCSSDISYVTTTNIIVDSNNNYTSNTRNVFSDNFSEMDENFWLEVFPSNDSGIGSDSEAFGLGSKVDDSMDFWFNVFIRDGEVQEMM